MSAGEQDDFGPVDAIPRAPYKPSERRCRPDDDNDDNNRQDWHCLPPPEPVPEPEVDLGIHPSGLQPVLQNVVSTFSMNCRVNLKHIAQVARNAEYNPRRFSAAIMRKLDPKTTALIFASGKGVCTGAKSEEESKLAARKGFQIQNLVATVDVGFVIFLELMALVSGLDTFYEPELFPGLVLTMRKPKVVFLIFVSGKVVITGAKDRKIMYEAFEKVYPVLLEYKKKIVH